MLSTQSVDCPYCGEICEIEIDPSAGKRQHYTEDCQVCCRPWKVSVRIGRGGEVDVSLATEDDAGGDE